jgi:hypothetical protein
MVLVKFIPSLVLLPLLWVMVRGGGYKAFPCFFTYTLFSVAATVARLITWTWAPNSYFYVYWSSDALYELLSIIAHLEVFRATFRNLGQRQWFHRLFFGVMILSIVLTTSRMRYAPTALESPLLGWIVSAELAVNLLQVLLFVLLVSLILFFGLRWRQYPFGISAGFGIYATVDLLATTKFSDFGTKYRSLWEWSEIVTYTIAALIWLWYFRTPQTSDPEQPGQPSPSLEDLRRYKAFIRRIWRK